MGYAGSNWIARNFGEMSETGKAAADLLGDVFLGIYHMNYTSLKKVDWTDEWNIEVTVGKELSSFDGDELTRLLLLAHDRRMRVSLVGLGPHYMRLCISKRKKRTGQMHERLPTMEDHIALLRDHYEREGCNIQVGAA
jgi:hypothetical protein